MKLLLVCSLLSFSSISMRTAFTGLTRISKQDVLNHVIIVGSCTYAHKDKDFYQSSFSNYGDGVSIFAPGSWVFRTGLRTCRYGRGNRRRRACGSGAPRCCR